MTSSESDADHPPKMNDDDSLASKVPGIIVTGWRTQGGIMCAMM